MANAFKCDLCGTLYENTDIGASLREFKCWKNYPWPVENYWLAKIVLISNGHEPYKYEQDICPDCSMKIANFLNTLNKQ